MSFLEYPKFPDKIAYGSTFIPTFNTTIVETGSGFEQRNRNWAMPRFRFDVGMGIKTLDDYYEMLEFFYAVGGMAYGFRFKNWMDYKSCLPNETIKATDQLIATADGTSREFQLIKTYTKGILSTKRDIKKPIATSVKIAIDYVEISEFEVDEASGLVKLPSPPLKGAMVTAGFEYDTPCRFDSDALPIGIEQVNTGSLTITLRELFIHV